MSNTPSSPYSTLQVSRESARPVTRITMSRPEVRNAFDEQLIADLRHALGEIRDAVEANEGPRVVVLTGSGKSFSAGADLHWMRKQKEASLEGNVADARALADLIRELYLLPCLTLGRVNGAAIGGGTGLVAACDISVALKQMTFAFSEVKLGLVPAVISPYVIKRIGERHAREYFLTAERFNGTRAAEIGLIQEAVDDEVALDAALETRIDAALTAGPVAIRECKAMIAHISEASLEHVYDYTAELIAKLRVSDEGQEGIAAFLEKRNAGYVVE